MINTNIVNLEQNMINLINSSNVPLAATYLILDKVMKQVDTALTASMKEEQQRQQEKEEQEKENI